VQDRNIEQNAAFKQLGNPNKPETGKHESNEKNNEINKSIAA